MTGKNRGQINEYLGLETSNNERIGVVCTPTQAESWGTPARSRFVCPLVTDTVFTTKSAIYTYQMNVGYSHSRCGKMPWMMGKISWFYMPSKTVQYMDNHWEHEAMTYGNVAKTENYRAYSRHNGKINMAYTDGHVGSETFSRLSRIKDNYYHIIFYPFQSKYNFNGLSN